MRVILVALLFVCAFAPRLTGQDRPFVFSVTTGVPAPSNRRTQFRVDYEVGGGERLFQQARGDQPEQQIALHATHGRFTLVGRTNLVSNGGTFESAVSGEVMVALRRAERFGRGCRVRAAWRLPSIVEPTARARADRTVSACGSGTRPQASARDRSPRRTP